MIDARAIRLSLKLTQEQFADRFDLTVAQVQAWEQHRREPANTGRTLLAVIAHAPDIVDQALKLAR